MEKTKGQIICDALCGIIMMLCVIVYLVLGVTINFWHPGWIIVVAGGLTCELIGIISNTLSNLKKLDKKEDEKDIKE